jgi:hypothetical protein
MGCLVFERPLSIFDENVSNSKVILVLLNHFVNHFVKIP